MNNSTPARPGHTQEAKHTAGPWHPQHQHYADSEAFEVRTGRAKGHYDDESAALIARVPFSDVKFRSVAAANAALIASAPDLLAERDRLQARVATLEGALARAANFFEGMGIKPRADSFAWSESTYAEVLSALSPTQPEGEVRK